MLTIYQGIDPTLTAKAFEQARRFFALPTEKKMDVFTGLVPNEFVGYHPMKHYNRNGWKKNGPLMPTFPLLMCIS